MLEILNAKAKMEYDGKEIKYYIIFDSDDELEITKEEFDLLLNNDENFWLLFFKNNEIDLCKNLGRRRDGSLEYIGTYQMDTPYFILDMEKEQYDYLENKLMEVLNNGNSGFSFR